MFMQFRFRFLSTKNKYFYYKLLLFMMIISLFPIFIFGLLFYHNAKKTMQEELKSANSNYLQQTVNSVEIAVNQISTSYRQLSFDGVIREFENFPLGTHYEKLKAEYQEEDLPVLYNYLSTKQRLLHNLSILQRSNELIQSVYFYDDSKELIMTSNGMQYTPDHFFDPGWNEFKGNFRTFPAFMEPRMAIQRDGSNRKVIPMLYMSPVVGNYFVINLDAEKIYNHLIGSLDGSPNNEFFIISHSGQLLLHGEHGNNELISDSTLSKYLDTTPNSSFEMQHSGNSLLVSHQVSEPLGWTFVSSISLDELYRSVGHIKKFIILISILLAVVTSILAIVSSRSMYLPIVRLLHYIHDKNMGSTSNKYRRLKESRELGEFKLIRSSLEQAYNEQERLKHRLKENMPALQEKWIRTLIHPHSLNREEILERLAFLNIPLEPEGLVLLILSTQNTSQLAFPVDVEFENLNKLRLIDLIEDQFETIKKYSVTEFSEGMFVIIINCNQKSSQLIHDYAQKVIELAHTQLQLRCSIGVGAYVEKIEDLAKAYEEAHEALRYRKMIGQNEVIHIDEIRLEGTPYFVYPKMKESLLIDRVMDGEYEKAEAVFNEIIVVFKEQQAQVDAQQLQHAFVRLLSSLVETSHELRIDLNEVMEEPRNLYNELLSKNEMDEIAAWFSKLLQRLFARLSHSFNHKNLSHVDLAVSLIEDNEGIPFSLNEISEQLGLNPSYFSRVFKKQLGITFSEYVAQTRIEKSKSLLLTTDLKIKEIAERIGYYKTSYFIKLFKDAVGVTPGEYRKIHFD